MAEEQAHDITDHPPEPVANLVAVGASIGDLDSLDRLLDALPDNVPYAVVVIANLASDEQGRLMDTLQHHARRPVHEVTQGLAIRHNQIFIPPPGTSLCALDGHFGLSRKTPGSHSSIDLFFNSLGNDPDLATLAIILSGEGDDGAQGLGAIRASGGRILVQDPRHSRHEAMPQAAVATGFADAILQPEEMPAAIQRLLVEKRDEARTDDPYEVSADNLSTALTVLQKNAGLNVSYYKDVNLRRRLLRRVLLKQGRSVSDYVSQLQEDHAEATALRDDLLIGVTSFFRNIEFIEALTRQIIPSLLQTARDGIRVWVPACSTGEEAYTIAMVLRSTLAEQHINLPVQIFGTDVNQRAISIARSARYPASALECVPSEYRDACFTPEGDGFVVNKEVRSLCVFAQHNVLTNPPFSNLDLVSCRNLFIYLRKEAQQQALEVFSYALKPEGFLLLGRSESASGTGLFKEVGKGLNLYSKRIVPRRTQRAFSFNERTSWGPIGDEVGANPPVSSSKQLEEAANRAALAYFMPAGFLVNETGEVLQFRGDTSRYLLPVSGDATLALTRLLRPELHLDVRGALIEAVRTKQPAHRERVIFDAQLHRLEVLPVPYGRRLGQYFLIAIHATTPAMIMDTPEAAFEREGLSDREADLERHLLVLTEELEHTRGQLKSVISEYEATNEELRTSNEEVLSSNEELQSTNEELKTAKDELEITNTELESLNQQLEERNVLLALLNDDLTNLIEGIPVPVLLLDRAQNIRHFSPQAALLFKLDAGNIGQPLAKSKMRFDPDMVSRLVNDVILDLVPAEEEIQDKEGRWFLIQARAYRTNDHRIEGAVVTFQDIHRLKRALAESEAARSEAERASSAKNDFLALVSHELRSPLNAIAGWASVLGRRESRDLDDEIGTKAIETIERNCRIQAQLIDDLLDVARISSGRLALDVKPLDFAAIVRSAVDGLAPSVHGKGIGLHTINVDDTVVIRGDARRLQQIITNLLQNAIKFTSRGGRIELRLERIQDLVELSVIDNGIGITSEALPTIFERFSQHDLSKTRQYGGLGLGLSIVKHLVTGHGGTVIARSEGPGTGARFDVRLPLYSGDVTIIPAQEPVIAPDMLNGTRILVVDDEHEGSGALCELLRMAGAEAVSAGSAADALAQLDAHVFDAIVSDIAMPGTHGQEFARMVRKREREGLIPRTHMIALTGFTSIAERDEALAAGFDDHVGKPVNGQDLIRRLFQALSDGVAAR